MTIAGAVGVRRASGPGAERRTVRTPALGRPRPRAHRRERARVSVWAGVVLAVAFVGAASWAGNAAIDLSLTGAVIASCAWLTTVAVALYRRARLDEEVPASFADAGELP